MRIDISRLSSNAYCGTMLGALEVVRGISEKKALLIFKHLEKLFERSKRDPEGTRFFRYDDEYYGIKPIKSWAFDSGNKFAAFALYRRGRLLATIDGSKVSYLGKSAEVALQLGELIDALLEIQSLD